MGAAAKPLAWAAPPSMADTIPLFKFGVLVSTTSGTVVRPGVRASAPAGATKSQEIVSPPIVRSTVKGVAVPAAKGARIPLSYPTSVKKPVYVALVMCSISPENGATRRCPSPG